MFAIADQLFNKYAFTSSHGGASSATNHAAANPGISSLDIESNAPATNASIQVGYLSRCVRAPIKIGANVLGSLTGSIKPVGLNAAVTAMGAAVLSAAGHDGYDPKTQALQVVTGEAPFVGVRMLQGLYEEGKAFVNGTNTRQGFAEDLACSFARGYRAWSEKEMDPETGEIVYSGSKSGADILASVIGDAILHGPVSPYSAGRDFASVGTGVGIALGGVVAGTCVVGAGCMVVHSTCLND